MSTQLNTPDSMDPAIPFLDLVTPHLELSAELIDVFRRALATASFTGGPMVEDFETDFAGFCETRYCVGVNSGTDALRFALIAAGVRPGDVVVTVPNTFIATTEAITQAGAVPDFVDVDERTYNMDPEKLRDYLENHCKPDSATGRRIARRSGLPVTAVVPVHLYGQMADMDPIMALAERNHLVVIEDACQAHGAEYFSAHRKRWYKAGSMGRVAAFSFYPGKNLGACGEAGAITTDDAEIASIIRMLRDHGQATKYYHDLEGYNGRLDAIQAGVLHIKLPYLQGWNEKRRQHASQYQQLLSARFDAIIPPYEPPWSRSAYHLYVVRSSARDRLRQYLASQNIGTAIHYPIPLHLQGAYRALHYRAGELPVAERVATQILSLPMYPSLCIEQQTRVVETILHFVSPTGCSGISCSTQHRPIGNVDLNICRE